MSWSRNLTRAGAWALCAWGCTQEASTRGAADAGRDSLASSGGSWNGSGGSTVLRDGSSSGGRATLPCEMDATADAARAGADASPDAAKDASRPLATADAAEPPTYCVAPCVWELIRNCRAEGACSTQDYPSSGIATDSVSCAPESDWWRLRSTYLYNGSHRTDDYYRNGSRCYSYAEGEACVKVGFMQGQWTNAAGDIVAYFLADCGTGGETICGPFGTASPLVTAFTSDGQLAPGFTAYAQDWWNPACAPWQDPVCEPGCCGTPPGPLQSFP